MIGFLKSNLPALALNRIINADGIKMLKIILRASDQPMVLIHQIESNPAKYRKRYIIRKNIGSS